jgi:hypothetical protein
MVNIDFSIASMVISGVAILLSLANVAYQIWRG